MDENTAVMRAADVDRERVSQQVHRAHAEGRLDLYEFDERIRQVWAARTYGELAEITTDLPTARPVASASPVPAPASAPGEQCSGTRGAVSAWLSISVLNLVIWVVVSVAVGTMIYPWWIWVAGPWGAILLARWVSGRVEGRPRAL